MSRTIVRVFAQGKRLDTILKDIRKALVNADAVQVDWENISDAIEQKPDGGEAAVKEWADSQFPKRWGFRGDDIVIDRG